MHGRSAPKIVGSAMKAAEPGRRGSAVGAVAALLTVVLLASGCGLSRFLPSRPDREAAAAESAACRLLDFDVVNWLLGIKFDTAGAALVEETSTCALTQGDQAYPDVTLSVSPCEVSIVIFMVTVQPTGSVPVKELGLVAYRFALDARAEPPAGPGVELGWLSDRGQLLVLRFTSAPSTTQSQLGELTDRLLTLAHQIESDASSP